MESVRSLERDHKQFHVLNKPPISNVVSVSCPSRPMDGHSVDWNNDRSAPVETAATVVMTDTRAMHS